MNTDFSLDTITRELVTSLAAKQVCLGPERNATCTDFVAKKKIFSLLTATTFRNLQQSVLLQNRFDSWVVKSATQLFNSYRSNAAKQVARFTVSLDKSEHSKAG